MGMGYYPALNPPVPGIQPELIVSGKTLAEAMPALDELSEQLGVQKLGSFHSESIEESFALLGESVPPGMPEKPIEWFEPEMGLKTIRALRNHVASHTQISLLVKDARDREKTVELDGVMTDLQQLENVLGTAAQHKSKFRLRIDI